jgi:hypothetical protein
MAFGTADLEFLMMSVPTILGPPLLTAFVLMVLGILCQGPDE